MRIKRKIIVGLDLQSAVNKYIVENQITRGNLISINEIPQEGTAIVWHWY